MPPFPCEMSKNRRVNALQISSYHVIMGLLVISVQYLSTPTQFSWRAADFPVAFFAQRHKAANTNFRGLTCGVPLTRGIPRPGLPRAHQQLGKTMG